MFRKNQKHLQPTLVNDLGLLSERQRRRLEQSWAAVFRREVFSRLDETPFAALYADIPSRPNIPINVLVGLEALKAGRDWSDEEMHDAFSFDLQVRYALGYENLGDGEFDVRTIYNFRQRLSEHLRTTGQNLMAQAFAQVTDAQIGAFQLKTGLLRMDSTQIASNVCEMSRLQLLVEVLQRFHRILGKSDQAKYADAFAPYLKGTAAGYVYQLKARETDSHLQQIGELMQRLLVELASTPCVAHATYQMLQRVFHEQFTLTSETPLVVPTPNPSEPSARAPETTPAAPTSLPAVVSPAVQLKPGEEIAASSLLSPDDPEATFRRKGNRTYQGYVSNVTETCSPENPFQLIVQVQTSPNTTEDTTLLLEALPDLRKRTAVDTLYNDGAFCSPAVDRHLRTQHIVQVPTGLKGFAPNPARLSLADFTGPIDLEGIPQHIACPQGQSVPVETGRGPQHFLVRFDPAICQVCALQICCPTRAHLGKGWRLLRFTQTEFDLAQRRQRCKAYHQGAHHLRAAVEATIGALKRPFSDDQLPVRGKFRMGAMMIGSAFMVNVRRIQRYVSEQQGEKKPSQVQGEQGQSLDATPLSFLSALWMRFLMCFQVKSCFPTPLSRI